MSNATAVSCTLPAAEEEERHALLQRVLQQHSPTVEFDDRWIRWTFPSTEALAVVDEVVTLERQCCTSLQFQIEASPTLRLTVSGGPGTGPTLAKMLGVMTPTSAAQKWWVLGSLSSLLGGVFAMLCCVLPFGATAAAAVAVPLVVFDQVGLLLLLLGAVLGFVAWSRGRAKVCAC